MKKAMTRAELEKLVPQVCSGIPAEAYLRELVLQLMQLRIDLAKARGERVELNTASELRALHEKVGS